MEHACEILAISVAIISTVYLLWRLYAVNSANSAVPAESMCVGQGCSVKTLLNNAIADKTGLRTNYC